MTDQVRPDLAGSHVGRARETANFRMSDVQNVHVLEMPGGLLGPVEVTPIAGAQVLLEPDTRGVVLEVSPGIPIRVVPVAEIQHAELANPLAVSQVLIEETVNQGIIGAMLVCIGGRQRTDGPTGEDVRWLTLSQQRCLDAAKELVEAGRFR